ncbi:MAG: cyclic nucleotide-binding domain-containing protein [Deltaproteobacteria bacterium]
MSAINAVTFAKRFESLGSFLSGDEIEELLRHLPERRVATGEVILREGGTASQAFLVWEGTLAVRLGDGENALDVGRSEPGMMVGEIAFLDSGPVSATVTASTDGVLLVLGRAELEKLRDAYPRIATSLLRALSKSLAARLRGASAALERMRGVPPTEPSGHHHGILDGLRTLFGLARH